MPNTTNFSWPTPADTDLVKDGAEAIRDLGNGVDTSFINLLGGTTGQVLTKTSGTDLDFSFASPGGGLTLIATATPSAASTVSFTSIATNFKTLKVIWQNCFQSDNSNFWSVTLNNDTSSVYSVRSVSISNATVTQAGNGPGLAKFGTSMEEAVIPNPPSSAFISDFYGLAYGCFRVNRANSVEKHSVDWEGWTRNNNTNVNVYNRNWGFYNGTAAAVTRIDFVRSGSSNITGTFYLFGEQ